jgi:predicted TIM-barrel fold metal-dependent hydrolase
VSAAAKVLGVTHTPPAFDVPKNACDCHVHVFDPPSRFPLWAGRTYTPDVAVVEQLEALQRALHFDRVVVVHPSPYGTDNACTLAALRHLGPRSRGVAVIDDNVSDAALRDMHEAGMRGVRVNLATAGVDDPAAALKSLQQAARRAADMGWHLQTYTTLAVIAALAEEIARLPTTLVVDHFGRAQGAGGVAQPGFATLLKLVGSGKAYVKLSAPHRNSNAPDYADMAPIARALIAANPDRILWGSDWPHTGTSPKGHADPSTVEPFRGEDDGRGLNRLAEWTANSGALNKILVENPARLYDYPN